MQAVFLCNNRWDSLSFRSANMNYKDVFVFACSKQTCDFIYICCLPVCLLAQTKLPFCTDFVAFNVSNNKHVKFKNVLFVPNSTKKDILCLLASRAPDK